MDEIVPPEVVSTPSIDLLHYFNLVVDFFVSHYPEILSGTKSIIGFLVGLSIPISILLFLSIIYCVERIKIIRKKQEAIMNAKVDMAYDDEKAKGDPEMAHRWDKVTTYISSQNPNDWRQAIIEADILLGSLLTKMGYRGESIGEQLQRVARGDFQTIDQAWEAHTVRNNVAHEGSNYKLDHYEAQRAIGLYKQVFQEFFYI